LAYLARPAVIEILITPSTTAYVMFDNCGRPSRFWVTSTPFWRALAKVNASEISMTTTTHRNASVFPRVLGGAAWAAFLWWWCDVAAIDESTGYQDGSELFETRNATPFHQYGVIAGE
jgi:hypothetical protein